jgi:endonuclease/exonuclease/phosphatase family metal-dependent hydrolase
MTRNMNKDAESWARVMPRAVVDGSVEQARNVLAMALADIRTQAAEIDRLQAVTRRALAIADERGRENVELRDDRWRHGAESMRHAILQQLPNPTNEIGNMIRSIGVPSTHEQKSSPSDQAMAEEP